MKNQDTIEMAKKNNFILFITKKTGIVKTKLEFCGKNEEK